MKAFGELEITLDGMAVDDFITVLERHLGQAWRRNAENEAEVRRFTISKQPQFCYTVDDVPDVSPAHLWLVQRDADSLNVSNILSTPKTELSYDEYNSVLRNFYELVAAPAATEVGKNAVLAGTEISLEDMIPGDVVAKLKLFSAAANKKSGSSHPLDLERWLDFLQTAYRSENRLTPDRLGRWLREVERWPDDTASQLVGEYEFAMDLLRHCDRKAS